MSKKKQPIEARSGESYCRIPLTAEESQTQSGPTDIHQLSWRIFRIMAEFVDGFQILSETSKEITFWGGTQIKPASPWYKFAEELSERVAREGYTVITGGGPGIMEAANKGAKKGGGTSIGFNIQLPKEQSLNKYVTKGHAFHYFFSRKVMMAASAQAYVFFPGGFGTMDEFFEIVTLIETGKMQKTPVICVGKEYWSGLMTWINKTLKEKFQTVHEKDVDIFQVVDTVEQAYKIIVASEERLFF